MKGQPMGRRTLASALKLVLVGALLAGDRPAMAIGAQEAQDEAEAQEPSSAVELPASLRMALADVDEFVKLADTLS